MEKISIRGLTLFFDAQERQAAELVGVACERSIQIMEERWGLGVPEDCRVYIMTSWLRVMFHSAPWGRRILWAVLLPLWYSRVKKLWTYAGGWARRFGRRQVVGVKPPRLVQLGDRSIGERMFIPEESVEEKVQSITCHELVHAFTDHLQLPTWLHEGLAMVTVDAFLGKPTVKRESIQVLAQDSRPLGSERAAALDIGDQQAIDHYYIRGYWLTRYLSETQPELLRSLLLEPQPGDDLEGKVAAALMLPSQEFWQRIDEVLTFYFGGQKQAA